MRGSKREGRRPGTSELRVDAGRDPLTGSRKQKSVIFEGGSREADVALAELITKASRGCVSVGTRTVADAIEAGLRQAELEGLEPTTIRNYRTAANTDARLASTSEALPGSDVVQVPDGDLSVPLDDHPHDHDAGLWDHRGERRELRSRTGLASSRWPSASHRSIRNRITLSRRTGSASIASQGSSQSSSRVGR